MAFQRLAARFALALALLAPGAAFAGQNLCTASVAQAERTYGIPEGLLQAIAIHESGVNGQPYPWALNLGGRVVYAGSIDKAQQILGERKAKGRRNLYAGCMQLSVHLHGSAFASTRDLLQPQRNVAYAAKYLAAHFEDYGDWPSAVRRYHGGKPRQSAAYVCKILHTLGDIQPASAQAIDNGRCGPMPTIAVVPAAAPAPEAAPEAAPAPLSARDLRELS